MNTHYHQCAVCKRTQEHDAAPCYWPKRWLCLDCEFEAQIMDKAYAYAASIMQEGVPVAMIADAFKAGYKAADEE